MNDNKVESIPLMTGGDIFVALALQIPHHRIVPRTAAPAQSTRQAAPGPPSWLFTSSAARAAASGITTTTTITRGIG